MEGDVSNERNPRYWLAAKFGNKNEFIDRTSLIESLEPYSRCWSVFGTENGLYFFIIDDYPQGKNILKKFLHNQFHEQIYLFNTTGSELNSMRLQGSFEESTVWCAQFIMMCVLKYENALDFVPIEEKEEDSSPLSNDDESVTLSLASDDFPNDLDCTMDDSPEPTGDLFPVKPHLNGVTTSSSNRPTEKRDIPPAEVQFKHEPRKQFTVSLPMFLEPPVSAELVAEAVSHAHECPDFASTVIGEKLFRRFQIPFHSVEDNYRLLELVYNTMKPTPKTVAHRTSTLRILQAFTDSRYVEYVCVLIRTHDDMRSVSFFWRL